MIRPRKTVQRVEAYAPPLEGRSNRIRLDFNENTAPKHLDPLTLNAGRISTYPEYQAFEKKVARAFGLSERNILLFNGSGEAIFTMAFTFIEPGKDKALASKPTFALIPHALKLVGANLTQVSVKDDLSFDLHGIEAALDAGIKMAILASPDNPTGASVPISILKKWCAKYGETLFVIDEAYQEYGSETFLPLISEYENLLVLRTFSKAWGMAGLRLGLAAGSAALLDEMRKVRSPYSVNAAAVACGERFLKRRTRVLDEARSASARKHELVKDLKQRGFRVHDLAANFLLIDAGRDAEAMTDFCMKRGVLVRNRPGIPGFSGAIRISTGTKDENNELLEAFDAFRATSCIVFDLDNTLVDTSMSYDETVKALVQRHTNEKPVDQELMTLRASGGYNDDWKAAHEIIRQRGGVVEKDTIIRQGKALYLERASQKEKLLVSSTALAALAKRYRLFIYTGRPRDEYAPIWGAQLDPLFERTLCVDDWPAIQGKPAPDQLNALLSEEKITQGYYIGDNVDDMKAAALAGLHPIGVTQETNHENMIRAGARAVFSETQSIFKEFGQ